MKTDKKPGIQHVKWQSIGSGKPSEEWSAERHLNGGKQEIGNSEVTPWALWPVLKTVIKRDGPKAFSCCIFQSLGGLKSHNITKTQ
jgi:hypothetical protein